ncbi:MAG: methionine adenosyltransferase [Proteobacteria bacterium]|nr:methionine adenosyltransferase [Alphaproteobacteria bacterium]NCC02953.1 methionine adenosyltransferase [Pseudomonadota bacterium]
MDSNQKNFFFTSESVGEGHPDKVCDRISDAFVDMFLKEDPHSRVAVETLATTNRIVIAGEVRGPDSITPKEMEAAARDAVHDIGYAQKGFHWQWADVQIYIHAQSSDIAMGVDGGQDKDEGAGDQGIMFGFACNETPTFMPAPISYSHDILRLISEDRHAGKLPQLCPDAKSQVTLEYVDGKPVRASRIVVSTQHDENVSQEEVRELVRPYVLKALPQGWMCEENHFYVNPTGRFVIGGPDGDTGLTGRKIIVDTYGGAAPHGGGAFSGKDPTKVDRSAAYMARYLAKNVVAAGIADRCTIQLAYAIGIAEPMSVYATTHGTNHVDDSKLVDALRELVGLTPKAIRKHLELNRPIYKKTSSFGHFGREPEDDGHFSWERLDLVGELKRHYGL